MGNTKPMRNKILQWVSILLPPFFLVPLIWIPFDLITLPIWLIADIFVLISVIRIIKILITRPTEKGLLFFKIMRPTLTIVVFIVCVILVKLSLHSADKYALETSENIQSSCIKNGICPEIGNAWEEGRFPGGENLETFLNEKYFVYHKLYGKFGAKYIIYYTLKEDKSEFSMTVKHNIDEGLSITGGVNKELKIEKWRS